MWTFFGIKIFAKNCMLDQSIFHVAKNSLEAMHVYAFSAEIFSTHNHWFWRLKWSQKDVIDVSSKTTSPTKINEHADIDGTGLLVTCYCVDEVYFDFRRILEKPRIEQGLTNILRLEDLGNKSWSGYIWSMEQKHYRETWENPFGVTIVSQNKTSKNNWRKCLYRNEN